MTLTRKLTPVPFTQVKLDDVFWAPRIDINRTATIPAEYQMCEDTGRLASFELKWKQGDPNPPHIFWDSDVAKWIEAASYSLATHPDEALSDGGQSLKPERFAQMVRQVRAIARDVERC